MILWSDFINGVFETFGGVAIFGHVWRLWKAKRIVGYNPWSVAFFTAWGYWNLFYYPNLAQWWSFTGGLAIVTGNTIWVALLIKYRNNK